MARDDGGGATTILITFMLGAISGAAIALLLAPVPGERTRRYVTDRAQEGKRLAEEAARRGREFVRERQGTIKEAVERGREAYHQAHEEVEQA